MYRRTLATRFAAVALIGWLGWAAAAPAQDSRIRIWSKENREFGMDAATFERRLGAAFRQTRIVTVADTIEEAADQVSEVRIFLIEDPKSVVGEVVLAGKVALKEIAITLESGAVRFQDDGQAPDRKRGDGIFTARFPMNTDALWAGLRKDMMASARAVSDPGKQRLRRGPRDVVPFAEGLAILRKQHGPLFEALNDATGRLMKLAEVDSPREAANRAGVDLTKTPLVTFPGPVLSPKLPFPFRRVFDLPVFEVLPVPMPVAIDANRSLMVVDPGVVDNPDRAFDPCAGTGTEGGPWSFGHLMRQMSQGSGLTAEEFTLRWLTNWVLPQEANGWIVDEPVRASAMQSRVIASWQRLSGAVLDIDKFPARLLAIVNRPDLADRIGYGSAGSAGEGRFVFGLMEKPNATGACVAMPFTVIFEYGIKGGSCSAVKTWHQRWKDLDAHAIGSAGYNAALEAITRNFTDHGSNPAQSPNRSALNQLRTNENALDFIWQLREFRLDITTGLLDLVTVKQTPDDSLAGPPGTPQVSAYLVANEVDILAGRHVVPERFPGAFDRFLGARSNVPFPPSGVFWNPAGLTNPPMTDPAETRRKFSLGTCNACHGGETDTFFTHIGNRGMRQPNQPAALSRFLTGFDFPDPVAGVTHHYEDLAEREQAMSNILTNSCFGLLGVRRLPFVH